MAIDPNRSQRAWRIGDMKSYHESILELSGMRKVGMRQEFLAPLEGVFHLGPQSESRTPPRNSAVTRWIARWAFCGYSRGQEYATGGKG
jgi:hypothetical protein